MRGLCRPVDADKEDQGNIYGIIPGFGLISVGSVFFLLRILKNDIKKRTGKGKEKNVFNIFGFVCVINRSHK